MANKVDIRSVNRFLKDKGIDPTEFKLATGKFNTTLSRKNRQMIMSILGKEHKALVYIKHGIIKVRDMDRKYQFELKNPKVKEVANE